MPPFYGWGSTASRPQPLRGGSLLFTSRRQFTHCIPSSVHSLSFHKLFHLVHNKVHDEVNRCTSLSYEQHKITRHTIFSWTGFEECRLLCSRKPNFSSPENLFWTCPKFVQKYLKFYVIKPLSDIHQFPRMLPLQKFQYNPSQYLKSKSVSKDLAKSKFHSKTSNIRCFYQNQYPVELSD